MRKATFCVVKDGLLQGVLRPFVRNNLVNGYPLDNQMVTEGARYALQRAVNTTARRC